MSDITSNTNPEEELTLWSPRAAINFSVLFTPIFGAYIQAQNWKNLGKVDEYKNSKNWFYISIGATISFPFLPDSFGYIPALVLIAVWYYSSGLNQMQYFKEKQIEYIKRSWKKAILWSVLGNAIFFGVVFGVLTAMEPSIESKLEEHSVALVTDIIQNQFKQSSTCTSVEITNQASGDLYMANATLDNGEIMLIKLRFDGVKLLVEINNK